MLSPPPVDNQNHGKEPFMPENYHGQRQQSVGFNLQQEFEALKNDLDLDLSHTDVRRTTSGGKAASPESLDLNLLNANTINNNNNNTGTTGQNGRSTHHQNGHGSLNGQPDAFSPNQNHSHVVSGPSFLSPQYGHGLALTENLAPQLSSSSFLPSLSAPSRPQSVNDFSNLLPRGNPQNHNINNLNLLPNFFSEMYAFTSWIENQNPQDIITMLDHWCNCLPFDILLTMKSRLEAHLSHAGATPTASGPSGTAAPAAAAAGNDSRSGKPYLYMDFDPESPSSMMPLPSSTGLLHSSSGLAQPKPKNNAFKNHVFANVKPQRPKSADPSLSNRLAGVGGTGAPPANPPGLDRVRSPTSHLYEKTNFLQLAAASHSPLAPASQPSGSPEENFDLSAASKMGALATINSRVALDSNRKSLLHHHHQPQQQSQQQQQSQLTQGQSSPQTQSQQNLPSQTRFPHLAISYEESLNRAGNSSSVPASSLKYTTAAVSGPSAAGLKLKKDHDSPKNRSSPSTPSPTSGGGASSMPAEIASVDLLNNIPAWLKLLRLHKYTDCLKGLHWKTLIELSDEQLEERGVKALGARRKLLKAFDAVKAAH